MDKIESHWPSYFDKVTIFHQHPTGREATNTLRYLFSALADYDRWVPLALGQKFVEIVEVKPEAGKPNDFRALMVEVELNKDYHLKRVVNELYGVVDRLYGVVNEAALISEIADGAPVRFLYGGHVPVEVNASVFGEPDAIRRIMAAMEHDLEKPGANLKDLRAIVNTAKENKRPLTPSHPVVASYFRPLGPG